MWRKKGGAWKRRCSVNLSCFVMTVPAGVGEESLGVPPLSSCVTLGESLDFSVPRFPDLFHRVIV